MKKILGILLITSLLYTGCDSDQKTETSKSGDTTSSKKVDLSSLGKQLDNAVAEKMIKDLKLKKKDLKFKDLVWAQFSDSLMRAVYTDPTISRVTFFLGVTNNTDVNKNDLPIIILQLYKKDDSGVSGTFLYYEGSTICPPPYNSDCGTVDNPNSEL